MLEKRPAPYLLPIIVPRGARIEPSESDMPGYVVEMEWKWIIVLVLAGVGLYALAEEKGPSTAKGGGLGDLPKKAKTKRLYYMQRQPGHIRRVEGGGYDVVTVPRKKARQIISEAEQTGKDPVYDLYPVYASSAGEARSQIESGSVPRWRPETVGGKPKQMTLFGGLTAHCSRWDQFYSDHYGKEIVKCARFAPACDSPEGCAPRKKAKTKIRTCVKFDKFFSFHYMKDVRRCVKFAAVCSARFPGCLKRPGTKPPGMGEPSKAAVTALAKELASEEAEGRGVQLAREIKARGGISSYRGGYLKEEYKEIPLHLKKKTGLPLDEMASELGLDEAALVQEIRKAYPKGAKKKRRASWRDFEDKAYRILLGSASLGQYKEQELFPGLRREMVLEMEDVAKSDDPLTICLERKGWKLARISELRNSIIRKRQPDVMTGKVRPLSRSEKELEADTDECFRAIVARPTKGPPKQQALFGRLSWFR